MVIGPGGAGVSVTAASGALSRSGHHRSGGARSVAVPEQDTLLITVDRCSPTADLLGVFRQPDEPVAVSARLHLLSLDRLVLLERTWSTFTAVLTETVARSKVALPGVGSVADIDAGELSTLPGVEDFLVLRRIRDEAVSGQWRRIVVDASGLGDPFEFLRAASVLSQALNRLWPRHRRLAAAAERPVMAQLTAAVDAIDRDCVDVTELVTDPHAVAMHVVVGADHRGEHALPHLLATVDVMGLALRSVMINHGVGAGHEAGEDGARVDRLRAAVGDDVEVAELPRLDVPIDRAARLRKLGVGLPVPNGRPFGSGAAQVTEATDGGSGTARVYELSWRQRLPDPDGLQLGRSGDDLLVTVGGFRHPVRLPSVLRRCVVVDAMWDGAELTVRFMPDPALWPQGR
ncbi:ArsA family ATPase [Gordonia sp. SID5947]|uniref:ArsA-related P-loop ATPase n=1 Tax=Gordonia sp. SID5947 TaxID=2690315 RepID=UPI00136E6403|nr:ArsA family ATPase [Gordonia sp. SID5947]